MNSEEKSTTYLATLLLAEFCCNLSCIIMLEVSRTLSSYYQCLLSQHS